jgi:hypothetical protein
MNWKEFLKPDWRKIAILIILFCITSFYCVTFLVAFCPFTIKLFGPCTETYILIQSPCGMCIEDIEFIDIIIGIVMALIFPSLFLIQLFSLDFSLFFITNLIYDYLITCLIVWIYNKFRKKR